MTLGRRTALIAVYAERYLLSLFFLAFALHLFGQLRAGWPAQPGAEGAGLVKIAGLATKLAFNLLVGFLLLLGLRAAVPPQKFEDILIPLATTFCTLTYNAVPWFPALLQKPLSPPSWQAPLAAAGLLLAVTGWVLAIWSVVCLGRAFGVLVAVRGVVLGGIYKWVRHPMYLGYACVFTSLILVHSSVAYFILVPINISLLVYRAQLEEARLSNYSPAYREYMKRTGSFFPKLRRPASDRQQAK
jgi:protein-S-isoprenylcysteine O-methyltransferase Ste14